MPYIQPSERKHYDGIKQLSSHIDTEGQLNYVITTAPYEDKKIAENGDVS